MSRIIPKSGVVPPPKWRRKFKMVFERAVDIQGWFFLFSDEKNVMSDRFHRDRNNVRRVG